MQSMCSRFCQGITGNRRPKMCPVILRPLIPFANVLLSLIAFFLSRPPASFSEVIIFDSSRQALRKAIIPVAVLRVSESSDCRLKRGSRTTGISRLSSCADSRLTQHFCLTVPPVLHSFSCVISFASLSRVFAPSSSSSAVRPSVFHPCITSTRSCRISRQQRNWSRPLIGRYESVTRIPALCSAIRLLKL